MQKQIFHSLSKKLPKILIFQEMQQMIDKRHLAIFISLFSTLDTWGKTLFVVLENLLFMNPAVRTRWKNRFFVTEWFLEFTGVSAPVTYYFQ